MVVFFNCFFVKFDLFNDYFKIYQFLVGVVCFIIELGSNFGEEFKFKNIFKKFVYDVLDCYVIIFFLGEIFGWKIVMVKDNYYFEWNEIRDFIVFDYDQLLVLDVKDLDIVFDDDIGFVIIIVKNFFLVYGQKQDFIFMYKGEEIVGKFIVSGKYY